MASSSAALHECWRSESRKARIALDRARIGVGDHGEAGLRHLSESILSELEQRLTNDVTAGQHSTRGPITVEIGDRARHEQSDHALGRDTRCLFEKQAVERWVTAPGLKLGFEVLAPRLR